MSESIITVWDRDIGGDRYYYEMPAFDSVHAECEVHDLWWKRLVLLIIIVIFCRCCCSYYY